MARSDRRRGGRKQGVTMDKVTQRPPARRSSRLTGARPPTPTRTTPRHSEPAAYSCEHDDNEEKSPAEDEDEKQDDDEHSPAEDEDENSSAEDEDEHSPAEDEDETFEIANEIDIPRSRSQSFATIARMLAQEREESQYEIDGQDALVHNRSSSIAPNTDIGRTGVNPLATTQPPLVNLDTLHEDHGDDLIPPKVTPTPPPAGQEGSTSPSPTVASQQLRALIAYANELRLSTRDTINHLFAIPPLRDEERATQLENVESQPMKRKRSPESGQDEPPLKRTKGNM